MRGKTKGKVSLCLQLVCWCILTFLAVQLPVPAEAAVQDGANDTVKPVSARQNPILREFFRKRYLGLMHDPFGRGGPRVPNPYFVERHVDSQIDRFLEDVDHRLVRIESQIRTIDDLRRILYGERSNSSHDAGEARKNWREQLKAFREDADDLRKLLKSIFVDLKDSDRFEPRLSSAAHPEERFLPEIRFLKKEVESASREIRDYLFLTTHTVTVENLQGENMLIHLFHIREMAGRIRSES